MDNNPSRPQWSERYPNLSRRGLLRAGGLGLTGAGAALLFGCGDDEKPFDTSGPLETTRIRTFASDQTICASPMYLSREFLGQEGFTDVQTFPQTGEIYQDVADGKVDIAIDFGLILVQQMDAGLHLKALAGVHAGCYEVFAREGIATIGQLDGKKIAHDETIDPGFIATILRWVGIPVDERTLVGYPAKQLVAALANGEVDAVLATPPFNHRLRAAKVGHVVVSGTDDRPWAQYFCCMVYAGSDFVKKNPVATKHALRAFLKGADFIVRDPEGAARYLVEHKDTEDYDETLAELKHLNYNIWRTYDAEDSLRYFSLRMKDTGDIRGTPAQIIKKNADWRFVDELKREMPMAFAPPSSRFGLDCTIGPVERA